MSELLAHSVVDAIHLVFAVVFVLCFPWSLHLVQLNTRTLDLQTEEMCPVQPQLSQVAVQNQHSSGRWLLFPQQKRGDAGASFFTVIGSGYLSALEFISATSKALAFCTAWANVSLLTKVVFVVLSSLDLL